MITNAPSLLGVLLASLEILVGFSILIAVACGLRIDGASSGGIAARERLRHLLLLQVLLLAVLSAVSLFLWALLLQSYVPQWRGVRCIVGVLRVGTGSQGMTAWLPGLAAATWWLRGALLFTAGAGVVLHIVGRDQPEGSLRKKHLAALALIGVLALAGAVSEILYVVIPKKPQYLASGCCSTAPVLPVQGEQSPLASGEGGWITGIYVAASLALAAGLLIGPRLGLRRPWIGDFMRVGGAVLVLGAGLRFVEDVVAPARMGLPLHRCTWCLAAEFPETVVGLALLAVPALAAGWRVAAKWIGIASGPSAARMQTALDRGALFGVTGALLLFLGEWLVA